MLATIREPGCDRPVAAVRIAAVEALAETRTADRCRRSASRFAAEKDAEVRRAIALALGKLDDKEALDLLIAAFRDPDRPNRSATPRSRPSRRSAPSKAVKTLVELLTRKRR